MQEVPLEKKNTPDTVNYIYCAQEKSTSPFCLNVFCKTNKMVTDKREWF